jgi:predicted O-methyltransferase YrrM
LNNQHTLNKYSEFIESLKGTICVFGNNDIARMLIRKFPHRIQSVASLEPVEDEQNDTVPVISMESFEEKPTENVVIVDEKLKFKYLDILYEIMHRKGMNLLKGINIRYAYTPYSPEQHDFDYINTRNSLPMEFTIPRDSVIRLIDCIKTTGNLEGDILELGTGYGGSTYFIADTVQKNRLGKKIYSIDRFKNTNYLPELSFETVKKHLEVFPDIEIICGDFKEQLKALGLTKLCFCFIDAYATPRILEDIFPKIVPSGILLIDNYTHGCELNWGKPMADVFFEDKAESVIRVGNTQGMVIKQ